MKYVILAVIFFVAGWGAASFGPRLWQSSHGSSLSGLMARHPALDFSACQAISAEQVLPCAYGVLQAQARQSGDASLCADLPDAGVCQRDIAAAAALPAQLRTTCLASSQANLCEDLVNTWLAVQAQDTSKCNLVQNPAQRSACLALLPPVVVTAPAGNVLQFGMSCAANDTACQKVRAVFNKAVLADDVQQCVSVGAYKDQCQYEVVVHQAVTAKNVSLCQSTSIVASALKAHCVFDYYLAKALAGDTKACASLSVAADVAECQRQSSLIKGGRFDYLKS